MNHITKIQSKNRSIRWAAASILVIVFSSMLTVATNCVAQNNSSDAVARVYDNFNEKWIDPARWLTGAPGCWGLSLECVRQIQNGHLRSHGTLAATAAIAIRSGHNPTCSFPTQTRSLALLPTSRSTPPLGSAAH